MHATLAEIEELLDRETGVPPGAATVFHGLQFTLRDVQQFLETTRRDPRSPFNSQLRGELDASLRAYAAQRGYALGGGTAPEDMQMRAHIVTTVLTPKEQDAVVAELEGVAKVRFSPSARGAYTAHGVAYAVRQAHGAVLRRMVPPGASVLEVGANVASMAAAGVSPESYHACCPVLGVRDAVRHNVGSRLGAMARNVGLRPHVRDTARSMAVRPEQYYCGKTVQECSHQAEYIISNEACHDIDMDEMPGIMARHGATVWYGFRARAVGHGRAGAGCREVSAVGFRWKVDEAADVIRFNFDSSTAFGYPHKWSKWRKFEERVLYRWYGPGFDYVLARLPGTTASSMHWGIFRVPKARSFLQEVNCAPTGYDGSVLVRSFRPVRTPGTCGEVVGFEPLEFRMERMALDKVMEFRLALGEKGHLTATMSYMRSIRVLFYVNGSAVSVEQRVATDVLEAAAVVAELLAYEWSYGYRAEYQTYLREARACVFGGTVSSGVVELVRTVFSPWRWSRTARTGAVGAVVGSLRQALVDFVMGREQFPVVSVEPCEAYDCWEVGSGVVDFAVPGEMPASACTCREMAEVRAALCSTDVTSEERRALQAYLETLVTGRSSACLECNVWKFNESTSQAKPVSDSGYASSEADTEVFEDARDAWVDESSAGDVPQVDASVSGSVEGSCCETDGELCGELPVVTVESATGLVGDDRAAVEEYAAWNDEQDKCVRSLAVEMVSKLYTDGVPPTASVLERSTTSRTRHASASIARGVITDVVGPVDGVEPAEVYVPSTRTFHRVRKVRKLAGTSLEVTGAVTDGVCYFNTEMAVMNGPAMAAMTRRVLTSGAPLPVDMLFVNGPFGCGKTRHIIAGLKRYAEAHGTGKLLYLTAGKSNAARVAAALGVEGRALHERTTDSFVLHGTPSQDPAAGDEEHVYDGVVVDEMPMHHDGQVVVGIVRSGARRVICFGDVNQIVFQTFSATFRARFGLNLSRYDVKYMGTVHRCRVDAIAAWQDRYLGTLRSCTCCEDVRAEDESLCVVRIKSVSDLVRRPGVRYLVFTHVEKLKLLKHFGETAPVDVLRVQPDGFATVHEDQGETHDEVALVRLEPRWNKTPSVYSQSIYNRLAHALTAMTRHKYRFTYYTCSEEVDEVCHRVELSRCRLRRAVTKGEVTWDEVKGRAAVARVADLTVPTVDGSWFSTPYKEDEDFFK